MSVCSTQCMHLPPRRSTWCARSAQGGSNGSLGHILRMDPNRFVSKALHHIAENREEGDLLMDAPRYHSWEELRSSAQNRDGWRRRVQLLRHGNGVTVTMNDDLPGCKAPRHPNTSKPDPIPRAAASSPSAKKYVCRDAHEVFFRPREKGKRQVQAKPATTM